MTMLWICLASLVFIAGLFLWVPLILRPKTNVVFNQQTNVEIFKARLEELEQEYSQGVLNAEGFEQLKLELEQSLLTDVDTEVIAITETTEVNAQHWLVISIVTFMLVAISLGLYLQLGRSADYQLSLSLPTQEQLATQTEVPPSFQKVIKALEQKLSETPQDLEKWFLLANSYSAINEHQKSLQVYKRALEQFTPENENYPVLKGVYAQALFQAAGEIITPEVAGLIKEILVVDPLESSALILAGIQAFTTGNIPKAIEYWQQAKINANEQVKTEFLEAVIKQAQASLGVETTADISADDSSNLAKITLNLSIDPSIRAKTSAEQWIFVFARLAGERMPLAAKKIQVKDLPLTIVLDDSLSPMPTAKLSSATKVDITARISLSGNVRAQSGDFFTTVTNVTVKNNLQSVEMLINQQVK